MSQFVIAGATCKCSQGLATAPLKVTSQTTVSAGGTVATIQDCQPITNIGPFGMCNTEANPAVASATAAALGVHTPVPCVPAPTGTWIPKSPTVSISGIPCLTQDSTMMCAYTGQITVVTPGQNTAIAN